MPNSISCGNASSARNSCCSNWPNGQTSSKREREHALEYQKWQKDLAYFQNCRAAAQLHDRIKELNTLRQSTEDHKLKLTRIAADKGLEENELSYLKADLKDIDDLINKKSGSEYLKLIAELEEAKGGIKFAEQTIARLKKEKETNLEVINRVYVDSKRAETKVAECTDQIRTLTIDRTNIAMEIATWKAQLEKIETEIKQHSEDTEGAREALFALMQEGEEKKGQRSGILHQQDMLIEKSRMRTTELERLQGLLRQLDEEYAAKQSQLTDSETSIASLAEEKKQLDRNLSELEGAMFAQRNTLERLRNEIRENEQDAIRLEAAQQARGESGGKALEAVLAMEGVHGIISDLGKAPKEYTTALNVAAGNRLHFVVCDDDQIAADGIRYLKEERLGRVTFLPLNKLKPPTLPPLKEPGVVDYAVNLLDYDPKFDRAFAVALGATVVVDTLERARKLIGKYRMVTLEGELLEKSGAITGGAARKQSGPRGFGAAVDDEIMRIRSHLGELQGEAATLEAGVKRLTEEVDAKRVHAERDRPEGRPVRDVHRGVLPPVRGDHGREADDRGGSCPAVGGDEERRCGTDGTGSGTRPDDRGDQRDQCEARGDQETPRRHEHPGPHRADGEEAAGDRGGRAPPAQQGRGYQRCPARTPALHPADCRAWRRAQGAGRTQPPDRCRYRGCKQPDRYP